MSPYTAFNLGVDGFALIVMLILLYTSIISFDNTQDVRFMKRALIMLFSVLLFDFFSWLMDGRKGSTIHVLLNIDITLYYIAQIYAVIVWAQYVQYRVMRRVMSRQNVWISIVLPLGAVFVLLITNPLTHYTFSISAGNTYDRGPLSAPIALLVMGYLLFTSIWVMYKRSKELLGSTRREYAILAGFVIPPFIGAVIQMSHYGISLIWPMTTISMLLLYINRSRDEISIDALTGLNNRGSLDKYLLERVHENSDERLTLILMDVDKFKIINDELGHDMGDVALREVAEIIRQSFSSGHNFIARYGGDEFVVVIPQVDDPRMIDGFMRSLTTNVEHFNSTGDFPIQLSISCGTAFYPKNEIHTPEDLLKAADAQMYEEKERHHQLMGYKR
ncbi:MAG: diguanylate cyclase [Lachnospiraceae bacterium]|nr:diguanylate cyclase [Lachnospiraceae bacterium]